MEEIKNIYDNREFFDSYMTLRENENSHNAIIEQPAMMKLLPDVKGKKVLDLGCGYGDNETDFVNRGASYVLGIDLSEKMLGVAKEKNSHANVEYRQMDMADIDKIEGKFDLVYSSLAFHYVEDFHKLIKNIYSLLNEGGIILFSQEHPLTTSTVGKGTFNKDGEKYISYTFSNYNEGGKRVVNWFIDGLVKYHRPFAQVFNAITDAGFKLLRVEEPKPREEIIEKIPKLYKEIIKPSFLIIKAIK